LIATHKILKNILTTLPTPQTFSIPVDGKVALSLEIVGTLHGKVMSVGAAPSKRIWVIRFLREWNDHQLVHHIKG
jgi:hypothetical protein